MKIISLLENTALNDTVSSEHGLSLYIETEKHKILFDMGQTDLFARNAEVLGVDLKDVDIAILSHGHYDHGGGLKTFLEINKKAPVYISRYAFGDYYNGTQKYIGLDKSLKENCRLIFTDDEVKIDENLTLYSCNTDKKEFNLGNFGLTEFKNNEFVPDEFLHEQYLLIRENSKDILISGCSHKGILDITRWFSPHILVGGFHFSKLPLDDTLSSFAEYLNRFDTRFYTCHCTGTEQYEFMKNKMDNLFYLSCGETLKID